ncbi:uncharacterized protein C6G9.01c [Argentina anserina]|uniref:uncharacterized protein C6G9.01c n=1 Tax=Argentina anserina TaxID=57926 RepID=UPI002176811C|nr:uncharacterized protein C6G9.01c [Potentilla anserina]
MGKKSKSKSPKEVKENSVVRKPVVEEEKPTSSAKKATSAKKPASVIDEIFAGQKRKKAEGEKAKKKDEEASEKSNKPKRKKKRDLGFKDGAFVDDASGPKKRTNEGLAIYTEEELGINKADAGSTPLCPFDCDCCF